MKTTNVLCALCLLGLISCGEKPAPVIELSDIRLSAESLELDQGESVTLTVEFLPANATDKEVVWTSSDKQVASVTGGVVTGVGEGKATITAEAAGGAIRSACEVSVYGKAPAKVPEGAIAAYFTAGEDGHKVYFAKGNLQFQASTGTWRFAASQFEYVGRDNEKGSASYAGWIDLFCWATSGYPHGGTCYQPWSHYASYSDKAYDAYGDRDASLFDGDGKADWGYNPISNGGNKENLWRTARDLEWDAILNTRETPSGIRYAIGRVGDVRGLVILPDNWKASNYSLNNVNYNNYESFDINTISPADWNTVFEPAGAVFLPAAGSLFGGDYRMGNDEAGGLHRDYTGAYWSSSCYGNPNSAISGVSFDDFLMLHGMSVSRYIGKSVRLVQDCPK